MGTKSYKESIKRNNGLVINIAITMKRFFLLKQAKDHEHTLLYSKFVKLVLNNEEMHYIQCEERLLLHILEMLIEI